MPPRPSLILRPSRRALHTTPHPWRKTPRPAAPSTPATNDAKIPWRVPGKAVSQETRAFLRENEVSGGWGGLVEEVDGEFEGEVKRGMVVEMRR